MVRRAPFPGSVPSLETFLLFFASLFHFSSRSLIPTPLSNKWDLSFESPSSVLISSFRTQLLRPDFVIPPFIPWTFPESLVFFQNRGYSKIPPIPLRVNFFRPPPWIWPLIPTLASFLAVIWVHLLPEASTAPCSPFWADSCSRNLPISPFGPSPNLSPPTFLLN